MRCSVWLLGLTIIIGAHSAAGTSCIGGRPFLGDAKSADVVFLVRAETGSRVSVIHVIRGTAPASPLLLGGAYLAPVGSKWLVAAKYDSKKNAWFVPQCSGGVVAVVGEWAFGSIAGERAWWQAAPLSDVLNAVSTGAESLATDNPEKVIPFAGEVRPIEPLRVNVGRDCTVTRSSATVRVLLDDDGFVRHVAPVKGFGKCLDGAIAGAVSQARYEPGRPEGFPAAAWADVPVQLPYEQPAQACSRGHALRPATAVVVFDGKRLVITARPSSLNEAALAHLPAKIETVALGRQLDALDVMSAPRLVEFDDDDPCAGRMRDGMWTPGTILRVRSILGRNLCVQFDGSSGCADGHWHSRPDKNWFDGASVDTKRIAIDSEELTIPADVFNGDVVLLVITAGGGVRPARGKLWTLPPRFTVGSENVAEWPRLYSDYLDAVCRGAETVLLESASDLRTWDLTFAAPLAVEDFQAFGATWYPERRSEGRVPQLDLTRLRVLRSGSAAIRLELEKYRREGDPAIYARNDAKIAAGCAIGEGYRKDEPKRRAEEQNNRLRMTDPWSPHDN